MSEIIKPNLQKLDPFPVCYPRRKKTETTSTVIPGGKIIESTKTTTERSGPQEFLATQGIRPLPECPHPESIIIPYCAEYIARDMLDLPNCKDARARLRHASTVAATIDMYRHEPDQNTLMFIDDLGNPYATIGKPIIDDDYQGLNATTLLLRAAHTMLGNTHQKQYYDGCDFVMREKIRVENILSITTPIETCSSYYTVQDGEKVLEATAYEMRFDYTNEALNSTVEKMTKAHQCRTSPIEDL